MDIQEVINSITTAELEAEQIVRLATLKAKDIHLSGELEADNLKKECAEEIKKTVRLISSNAEVAANTKSDVIIKEGVRAAEKTFAAFKEKTDKAVDYIIGRFTEQYVDC